MEESPFNPDRMRRAVLAAENSENNEEPLSPSPRRSWMSPRGEGRIEPLPTSPRMSPRGRIGFRISMKGTQRTSQPLSDERKK